MPKKIFGTSRTPFCKYWQVHCYQRLALNYIIQERNTCMNKNKNKRSMGLNGHMSSRNSMLTSLQKGLYLIRIINIKHNFNHPPGGHEINNFDAHSYNIIHGVMKFTILVYTSWFIITTHFVCIIYVQEFKRRT